MRITAILVVVALASGCSVSERPDAGPPRSMLLQAVQFDGHSWVVAVYPGGFQITALEHHPDCPCTKRPKIIPGRRDDAEGD